MTVEQAILAANRMRPNNPFDVEDKWRWLAECDALIRSQVVVRSCTGDYENQGADRAAEFDELEETTELLAPAPMMRCIRTICAGRWTRRWEKRTGRPTSWRNTTAC